jgi:hypothetical protein
MNLQASLFVYLLQLNRLTHAARNAERSGYGSKNRD